MREYIIPPTVKEKERVIGGVLTMAQFGWLLLGGLIALGIFLMLSGVSKIVGVIIGVLVGGGISLPLAFYKKAGYPILKYWKFKRSFNKKTKKLPNKRVIYGEGGEK